jgi:hypothetical protein
LINVNKKVLCRKPIGNNIKNIDIKVYFKGIWDPKGMLKINLMFCRIIKDIKEKSIRKKVFRKAYLILFLDNFK